jgi:two-component system repressor protein LuxO
MATPASVFLFVDDEVPILQALKRLLRGIEGVFHYANSAQEALEIMSRETVDCIITDMRMPGMNGTELLTIVADQYPHTLRLILSGYSDQHLLNTAIDDNLIWGFIQKPWDNEEMIQSIKSLAKKMQKTESRT